MTLSSRLFLVGVAVLHRPNSIKLEQANKHAFIIDIGLF